MTRILVEKKEPFRLDERDMQLEIRDVLNIPGITGVRIFNGYDTAGIADIEKAIQAVFSETGQDYIYTEEPDKTDAACVFAVSAAIGQYNQREDYATQLLRILEPHSEPSVRVFKTFALYGDISETDIKKIKGYYINPLEMREIPTDAANPGTCKEPGTDAAKSGTYKEPGTDAAKPGTYKEPGTVEVIKGFSNANDKTLAEFADKYAIAMALDNLKLCKEYFTGENRDPTLTEMKVLDTYWSDHCRHSTFMTVLENVTIDENKYTAGLTRAFKQFEQAKDYVYGENPRPLCLMDIATMEMKRLKKSGDLEDLEKSDEVNACSIEATVPVDGKPKDMIVMFKNETHNHPTEMEPFGGASTCLGGAIRDPLSGRAYVYGAIRVTGSGDPREPVEDTLPGKLPQRKITQTAAEGYSSYGNGIGLALGHLSEVYDPGFKAKRMECGAVVAAAEKADIVRGKPIPGDVVVLVGGKTGRDGCGGATGSSKEHNDESLEKGGAEVQKGNPVIERNIVRLFRKPNVSRMIKICNDFGAGGVCVAVGELADGLNIDLDKVPVKYPGLDGTELAISESQERMAVVIDPGNLEEFLTEAAKENLDAVKIADVTDSGRVVMSWRGDEILNLTSEFLNSGGVRQSTNVVVTAPGRSGVDASCTTGEASSCASGATDKAEKDIIANDIRKKWLKNLSDLNVCSKQGLASCFDSTAGGGTVFMPYGGVYQKTPEHGLAMKLPLREGETDYGTLMTVGYNPEIGYSSPFHGAMYAVIESAMKIAAMGGDYRKVRLSFQEYFERLTNEKSWGKPYAALMGAFLAQDELGIPAIGGKDSMSGTFKDINVPPSLLSFAVTVADTTKLLSRAFKEAGNNVYLLRTPIDEGGMPDFRLLRQNMSTVYSLLQYGCIKSASVVGAGGIAAAVSEMAFGNGIGFAFDADFTGDLFAPQYASMILEFDVVPKDSDGLREEFVLMGKSTDKKHIEINGVEIPIDEALKAWEEPLGQVFPVIDSGKIHRNQKEKAIKSSTPISGAAKLPQVLIPVFPGSTGEYELEKRFKEAGAEVTTVLFRTQSADDIKNSYKELTEAINKSDIFALPSGMSAGAEPDGGGKLIALILRQPDVKAAVNKMINERKGLVLGIGEGFKALLKTGLIQTGLIQEKDCGDVVLSKHSTNRYHCTLKTVKIEEDINSPWLTGMSGEDETIPISGQDSEIHLSEKLYKEYLQKGQIVSQFTGACEHKSHSVEAMTSENGLVLGRIGLIENLKKGLYTNVFDAKESRIFKNAIDYIGERKNTGLAEKVSEIATDLLEAVLNY